MIAMKFSNYNIFNFKGFFILLMALSISPLSLVAQTDDDEDFWAQQLQKEVEVVDPVYMPVISLSAGILHFMGDIRNPGNSPMQGEFGYKLNLSSFFGKGYFFKLNFFGLYGNLQGHDFSVSRAFQANPLLLPIDNFGDPIFHNSSFRSEIFQAGLTVEYAFGHILGTTINKKFKPYISIGASVLITNPKGNYLIDNPLSATDLYYHFWSDGSVRNISEIDPLAATSQIVKFGNDYETDLQKGNVHDQGTFATTTPTIPFELGFDFYLSYRVNFRVSTTLNYSFSDLIDNYNPAIAKRYGLKTNGLGDMFLYTAASMHFDLFSDPKYIRIEQYFADIDFDYDVLMADEDGDEVWDRWDQCPGTPSGVEVDTVLTSPTVGCPFDSDGDGVPDYMDKESNTAGGSIIDEFGKTLSAEKLAGMFDKPTAVRRDEIKVIPLAPIWTRSITFTPGVIPNKFRRVDIDGDGYISFEELLKAVEQFFDQRLDLTLEEMYELNNFFFTQ